MAFREVLPLEKCLMKYLNNCSAHIRRYYQVLFTPSEIVNGICENFLPAIDDESNEITDDTSPDDNNVPKYSLKRLFHL